MSIYIGPHKDIPNELVDDYTMGGKIPISYNFIIEDKMDESRKLRSIWSKELIDRFVNNFNIVNIKNNKQGWECYPGIANTLVDVFLKYSLKNSSVAIIGSIDPWIEAICLNFESEKVTTVEYNTPTCTDNRIEVLSYENFCLTEKQYDFIISFSSIEHSGLGRYGDPLDPNGDRKAMDQISKKLKSDGYLIWGAPVGLDVLVWNAHRIYGKVRLPFLFENFEILEWFGGSESNMSSGNIGSFIQPILVSKHKF